MTTWKDEETKGFVKQIENDSSDIIESLEKKMFIKDVGDEKI